MTTGDFYTTAIDVLAKYQASSLMRRWDEAIGFGSGSDAKSFFIRDWPDSVNIVWLGQDNVIRDIAWIPSHDLSMGMFARVEDIAGTEITSAQSVGALVGPDVEGHLLVRVYLASAPSGTFYWIAADDEQEEQLRSFYGAVLDAYTSPRR